MASLVTSSLLSGCAVTPYRYGRFHTASDGDSSRTEVAIEYGEPHKVLDRMAWFFGIPSRILPLSANVNNHNVSEETTEKLSRFLQENDLTDVLVRVNQYDPAGEWRRLKENSRVAPGWRYTFGVLGLAGYTLLPGRVFGGDSYNPFTNSLYVNSDVPAVVMVEAAYAKDIHSRPMPGTYAAINEFPVLTLWRHTLAVNDILGYAQIQHDWAVERQTYRIVYPQMGVHAGLGGHAAVTLGTSLPFVALPAMAVGGALAGHAVGQTTIVRREAERDAETKSGDPTGGIQLTGHAELHDDDDPAPRSRPSP
jgi:hypothetical protein